MRVPAEMTSSGMPCSGGDAGHQRLGAVAAGDPQQVGTVGHRRAGQLAHVHGPRPLEQCDLGAEGLGLVLESKLVTFPPPERGFMIR